MITPEPSVANGWREIEPGECALCGRKSHTPEFQTLEEFCAEWRMNQTTFYRLRLKGKAPATIRYGKKHLITRKALEEWRQKIVSGGAGDGK